MEIEATEIPLHAQTKIIGAEGRYFGEAHKWAIGKRVRVVAVHRDGQVLRDDRAIGEVTPDDVIEFAPEIAEDGERRWSFVTSDATGDEIWVEA